MLKKRKPRSNKRVIILGTIVVVLVGLVVLRLSHAGTPYSAAGCLGTDSDYRACKDGSIEGELTRLYLGVFNRQPDPGGLQYWTNRALAGSSYLTIAQNFVASPEGKAQAATADSQFVTNLYQRVLHRVPASSELSYWTGQVAKTSRAQVAANIAFTAEASNNVTNQTDLDIAVKAAISDVPGSAIPTSGPNRFGVSQGGDLYNYSADDTVRYLDRLQQANAHWLRLAVPWASVETANGTYNWTRLDSLVRETRKRGIHLLMLVTITSAPKWANGNKTIGTAPATNPNDYGLYLKSLVTRYKDNGVKNWEIDNEPNLASRWGTPNPAAYVGFLKPAYLYAKSVDRGSFILTAGMGFNLAIDKDMDAPTFIKGMYNAGAKGFFDAVSYHPYDWQVNSVVQSGWQEMLVVRALMVAEGDGNKQIWATEYGAPSNDTVATQSAKLQYAYAAFASYPWSGPMFWFSMRDITPAPRSKEFASFGLMDQSFNPRPAFQAFQQGAATH